MSPALLCAIGEALYGPHWPSELAIVLDIDKRNIRRWAAGGREIPEQYRERLRALIAQRQEELAALAKQF